MGGECFRYVRLKRTGSAEARSLPVPARETYESSVLPQLIQAVNSWKGESVLGARWLVKADLSSGIRIRYAHEPGDRECSRDIVCPPSLDETLSVGWQHRRYGSIIDPKHAIAQTLMGILMRSPRELLILLDDDEMDCIVEDLCCLPSTSVRYGRDGEQPDYTARSSEDCGEQRDYTACSSEDCGYCGRCSY